MTYEPRTCTGCNGQKGSTETEQGADGKVVSVWRSCQGCGGQGVR